MSNTEHSPLLVQTSPSVTQLTYQTASSSESSLDRLLRPTTAASLTPTLGQRHSFLYRARRSKLATALVVSMALFVDMLIYGIAVPILPKIVERMPGWSGEASMDVGILFGSYALGLLIFTPIFGILSDKYQTRRTPMLVGLMGLAVCTILFSVAESYWQLLLARFAQGVSGGASWSIGLSMIADVYPAHRLGVVMGTVLSANTVGLLVGPPIGGFLFQYVSNRAPFYFAAFLALLDFLARLWVIPPTSAAALRPSSQLDLVRPSSGSFGDLFRILANPQIALTCLSTVVISGVYSGLEPTLPLFLAERFGSDESEIGLLFCAIVVPNVAVSIIVGWISDMYGRKIVTAIGMLSMAVSTPLLALPTVIGFEVVTLMMFGATAAVSLTPIMPELAEFVTQQGGGAYGQVYALFNVAYSFGMLSGPIVAGFLYQSISFQWEMVFFACTVAIFAPILLVADSWYRRKSQESFRIPSPARSTSRQRPPSMMSAYRQLDSK